MQHFGDGEEREPRASRRQLLRTAVFAAGGLFASSLLAACGNQNGGSASAASSSGASSSAASQASTSAATSAATTASSSAATSASAATTASSQSASAAVTSSGSSSASLSSSAGTTSGAALASTSTSAVTATSQAAGSPGNVSYVKHTDVKGNINFWHFWGSPVRHNAIRRIIGEFEQEYPGIKVTDTPYPFGDIWKKNLAAVAADSGMPDVIVSNRPQLRFLAQNNIYQSLTDLINRDKVDTNAFWPFTWVETVYQGKSYGLPYETDIRVLYYNKAEYADAGLDPSKPAQNWDELESYADKLDKKNGSKLEQVGFFPLYGSMGLDTWNWNNGGLWQDKDNNPTVNAEPNVQTAVWMKKWIDRYGWSNWNSFQATFGQGSQDGFMSGKMSMDTDIGGYVSFLNFYNPTFKTKDGKNLGWDMAPIPPNVGHQPVSFSGGFSMSIDRGVKAVDPAWEFIKYAVFVGQASWARDTYAMPTVESIAKTDPQLNADPHWKFLVQAMNYGRPGVYNPYDENFPGDVLGDAMTALEHGSQSPQQAMNDAQQKAVGIINRAKQQAK